MEGKLISNSCAHDVPEGHRYRANERERENHEHVHTSSTRQASAAATEHQPTTVNTPHCVPGLLWSLLARAKRFAAGESHLELPSRTWSQGHICATASPFKRSRTGRARCFFPRNQTLRMLLSSGETSMLHSLQHKQLPFSFPSFPPPPMSLSPSLFCTLLCHALACVLLCVRMHPCVLTLV